jgi:hypothetical protein
MIARLMIRMVCSRRNTKRVIGVVVLVRVSCNYTPFGGERFIRQRY